MRQKWMVSGRRPPDEKKLERYISKIATCDPSLDPDSNKQTLKNISLTFVIQLEI